jgi:pyridoxine 5-phosphate synthase
MRKLGVNIDHIASVRELRKGVEPDPVFFALVAEQYGADSIVCHLRTDQRHIKTSDIEKLKKVIHLPLNIEVGYQEEVVETVIGFAPQRITLVPEYRKEVTTEHGINMNSNLGKIREVVQQARKNNIEVSLFIDPQIEIIDFAKEVKIGIVEIHTGFYVNATTSSEKKEQLRRIKETALYAKSCGFFVSAGHGLDHKNIYPILEFKEIEEFNIGYSIVARSLLIGFANAVSEIKKIINSSF